MRTLIENAHTSTPTLFNAVVHAEEREKECEMSFLELSRGSHGGYSEQLPAVNPFAV